ncbi:DUF3102 domain-containing protein [Lawsonibacter sp. LCP25S3_G6]|uniref:DUF3102 domain-containing protein n=1 Tax=unclassified Lawsonibacter TaxID=2617946 RepID=UPI003F99C7D7
MKANLGRIVAQSMTKAAEGRTIEAITEEILDAQQKGGEAVLTIGRCLIEAKSMLPHGAWLPWLNEKVSYSDRTARRFMQTYREVSNRPALANLGSTKAMSLIALPEEELSEFLKENNVVDMTTRQLEQAIKERDEARKATEAAQAEASTAEQARAKMAEDMALLNARLNGAREDQERARESAEKLAAELEELKARPVDVAVETVVDPEAIAKARAEAIAEMQDKLDKAKEAKKKAEEKAKEVQEALAQAQRKLEEQIRAEKKAALGADKDIAQFEVFFSQVQETANKMRGLLLKARGREDQSAAQGMERALLALAEAIGRCAE